MKYELSCCTNGALVSYNLVGYSAELIMFTYAVFLCLPTRELP